LRWFACTRGATNTYVLLTLEGKFFGGSPVVHLYLNANQTTPFLSSRVDSARDHTLGKGAQYINGTGEQFLCGPVVDDRSIECAYFYGDQVGSVGTICRLLSGVFQGSGCSDVHS
jgi:hypothetical protein